MKISEVTLQDLKNYCGISGDDDDRFIEICQKSAAAFIRGYTGLEDDGLEKHEDFSIVLLIIVNDMYTNRDYTVDKASVNPIARQILDMYSVNYI